MGQSEVNNDNLLIISWWYLIIKFLLNKGLRFKQGDCCENLLNISSRKSIISSLVPKEEEHLMGSVGSASMMSNSSLGTDFKNLVCVS